MQAFAPSESRAQDYPSRAVRIIVPFGAGGPADVAARLVGNALADSLKQPFVIENRPGAGSVIGTQEAAKSAADGYTLLLMSNAQTANESLVPQRKYDLMRDLVPIAPLNVADLDSAAGNVEVARIDLYADELAAEVGARNSCRARAHEGVLNYGP